MMMDDVVHRLAELVHGLNYKQEAELLSLAQEQGLLLRRVRIHERRWEKRDLGILVAWQTETEQFIVIDANGCGSPSRVNAAGQRLLLSEADCGALHADMLALAEPRGRPLRAYLAVLALLVILAAQALILFTFMGELPGVRAALIVFLAGLALVLAHVAYSLASSRAYVLRGWRLHQDLWTEVLDRGLKILRDRTPGDYAQAMRSLLKRRIRGFCGAMALPLGLVIMLPGLVVLGISASEVALYSCLVWPPLLLSAIVARSQAGKVESHEEDGLVEAQKQLDLVARFNIGLRPLGAEAFALSRLKVAMKRLRGLARKKRGLRHTAVACETLLLALTVMLSIYSVKATPITAPVTLAGLTVALGLVLVGRAAVAMAAGGCSPEEAPRRVAAHWQQGPEEALESIELRGVTFQYPGAPRPLFKPTDLLIRRGEILAVTGPSGVGKSTLLRLALGVLEPTAGELRINGRPVSTIDPKAWRRQIGVVLQDEHVPVETLKSFLMGMSPLPFEVVLDSLDALGLLKEIDALPMGIQTLMAEGLFPAGLRERLLIARALLRRPALLVLDEATTRLDEVVQAKLLSDLRMAGIGVLIATHRESAVAIADRCVKLVPL